MTVLLRHPAALDYTDHEPAILRPWDEREAIKPEKAAVMAGKCERTIKLWAEQYHIGRKNMGRWAISQVALAMLLDDDQKALAAYLSGDRTSPIVTKYYKSEDLGDILPRLAKRAAAER